MTQKEWNEAAREANEEAAAARQSRGRMERALIEAVKLIKTWHNLQIANHSRLPGLKKQMDEGWRIYWRWSPEMKPIREALPDVDLDEVEKL